VGQVEDITPPAFHSPANIETYAVTVHPQQPNVVYLSGGNITNGSACPAGQTCPSVSLGVYVSTDCGGTFAPLSMGPNDAFKSGAQSEIKIDPVNPKNLYTMNLYGGPPTLFKSIDGGTTWANLFTSSQFGKPSQGGNGTFMDGGFVRSFDVDPGDPSHLVVAFHEDCYGPVAASSGDAVNGAVMCLAESRDGGATWSFFEGPIAPSSADGGAPVILSTHGLAYANPGDGTGHTLWFTNDAARARSSWQALMTYDQTGPFYAVNRNGEYLAPDGTVYLPGGSGVVYTSPGPMFGQSWQVAPGSPGSLVLGGDGRSAAQGGQLFASFRTPGTAHPILSAPLQGLGPFTPLSTPANFNGVSGMAYDVTHHILYGAAAIQGLWRVRTY